MSTVTCPPHPQTPPVLSSLALLPSELLLKIFSDLDPVYSTCLGLTCKRLYVLHRELHGSVRLETRCHTGRNQGPRLYELLEEWHLPGFEMCWCGHSRVKTARVECGVEAEGGRERKCTKCRITVFSKPQLRVKINLVYRLVT